MDDAQLLRYSRHILLPELGLEAQEKFAAANALVIGAGGLGAPVAQFLVAAGVGTLTLCDPDTVDLTNLQRQILYATRDVGTPKVAAAKARLAAVNPDVRIEAVEARIGPAELAPLVDARRCSARLQRQFRDAARRESRLRRRGRCRSSRAPRSASTDRSRYSIRARRRRRAITASSAKARSSKRRAARSWAFSRRWSASSARRRPPKR